MNVSLLEEDISPLSLGEREGREKESQERLFLCEYLCVFQSIEKKCATDDGQGREKKKERKEENEKKELEGREKMCVCERVKCVCVFEREKNMREKERKRENDCDGSRNGVVK